MDSTESESAGPFNQSRECQQGSLNQKASVFVTVEYFSPSLIFGGRDRSGALGRALFRQLAFLAKKTYCKGLSRTNTLAF